MAKLTLGAGPLNKRIAEKTGHPPNVVADVVAELAAVLDEMREQGDRVGLSREAILVARVRERPDGTRVRSFVMRRKGAEAPGGSDGGGEGEPPA